MGLKQEPHGGGGGDGEGERGLVPSSRFPHLSTVMAVSRSKRLPHLGLNSSEPAVRCKDPCFTNKETEGQGLAQVPERKIKPSQLWQHSRPFLWTPEHAICPPHTSTCHTQSRAGANSALWSGGGRGHRLPVPSARWVVIKLHERTGPDGMGRDGQGVGCLERHLRGTPAWQPLPPGPPSPLC